MDGASPEASLSGERGSKRVLVNKKRQVDGQIVHTEAGQLLEKAVSGASQLGHPVTPAIVQLLVAIRQVGTLSVKERKVRIMPHQWEEVERLMGLGRKSSRKPSISHAWGITSGR